MHGTGEHLIHQQVASTEQRATAAINKVEKLLIVAEATRTTAYWTFESPEPVHGAGYSFCWLFYETQ